MGFARRLADAVAIAGREAAGSGRRRAVILLLGDENTDDSLYAASTVRAYLRALRVPLYIWTLSPDNPPTAWGEATFVGLPTSGRGKSIRQDELDEAFGHLGNAAGELRRELESQRIVVLGGEHLPHRIELADAAAETRPAAIEPLVGVGDGGPP